VIVPKRLVEEIVQGRCVAFVGAGFSQPVVPTWVELLRKLNGERVRSPAAHKLLRKKPPSGFDLETAADLIRATYQEGGDVALGAAAFERAVHDAVRDRKPDPTGEMKKRVDLLREIPFRGIVTTNFDQELGPGASKSEQDLYDELLRGARAWWTVHDRWGHTMTEVPPLAPVLKLHGDANGTVTAPVVLSRTDYRNRVYGAPGYAGFLRALFATRTILYLGVSFTDAYLNEIRSEVLSMVGHNKDHTPRAYAILPDRPQAWCDYFKRVEGVEVLPYEVSGDGHHGGFTRWLEAIRDETSAEARLKGMLQRKTVVWVDPAPGNNSYGIERLRGERIGATVILLRDPSELEEAAHRGAELLITNHGEHNAARVLRTVATWGERPPVIVFGAIEDDARRQGVLRRGAYDYCTKWSELFGAMDDLFGAKANRQGTNTASRQSSS
jgi:hypothetical protein